MGGTVITGATLSFTVNVLDAVEIVTAKIRRQ